MNFTKIISYFLLAGVILILWNNWIKEQNQQQTKTIVSSSAQEKVNLPKEETLNIPSNRIITVKTDVLHLEIDALGGNIIEANLLKYTKEKNKTQPVQLMNDQANYYLAQSGLLGHISQEPDTLNGQAQYQFSQSQYQMNPNEKELAVDLYWQNQNGLKMIKRFTFTPHSYLVRVQYLIDNQSNQEWRGNMYTQFVRKDPIIKSTSLFGINSFEGASMSTHDKAYKKFSFKDINRKPFDTVSVGGWIAMQQHYFLAAWIPSEEEQHHFYTREQQGIYTVGQTGEDIRVPAGGQKTIESKIYIGPEIVQVLEQIAPNLKLTIDYGWLWFISSALFWLLQKIYLFVGNWGWAIILLTLLIKLAFYQLSAASYKSMANMRKIQPKMQALKEKFGEDRQAFNQAILEMYKKEKINPFGGCLPILVQIPVFIALYWVLMESVELRHAPFVFWIQDLSARDPYFILPLLMGLSMLIQQKLNPPPPDPMQAKVMMALPVIFTALFLYFPSGLVLYWVVNNTLSIIQQWYITRRYA